ncbi:hypothetical protein [Ulvibacter antarcticus]|uniref:Uncharacterized protein n=1 Tax=Ulvibacter antarcticus TaxID=442714 RepID=A0A3L9YGG7_9FLAO|nr:hypothetical protein [Ulvibacter antarcticus]RMA58530.1 hypothetical protein BXY75_1903 [Ulvibacter antarcticus]
MATAIESYQITYLGGGKRSSSREERRAIIHLYDSKKNRIGIALFYIDSSTMPDTDESTAGLTKIHYPNDSYHAIVDLLRNEDPIFLNYYEDIQSGSIETVREGVGEHELP